MMRILSGVGHHSRARKSNCLLPIFVFVAIAILLILLPGAPLTSAQPTVIATIPLGSCPFAVSVNRPLTASTWATSAPMTSR